MVLFGLSGSGKTLTLQMIAGLVKPDKGFVSLNKEIYFDHSTKINIIPQKRPIRYVFQDLALFPHMTVLQNILYGAYDLPQTEATDRAHNMIKEFKLIGLENSYPYEISGGQKQRVAFARALIRRPKVLLLDEPFSALDRPLRLEMRKFLREIKNSTSIPTILITHDIDEASISDKMIIYENGKIIQIDSPKGIKANPASQYVSNLIL